MVIDVHTHGVVGGGNDEKKLLRAIEKYGIDKIYISNIPGPYPSVDEVDAANSMAERFIKAHSDCVDGYVYVSPELPNAMDVLQRGIEEQGFSGVKFWISVFCNDHRVDPLVEKMIDYGVPLLLHVFHKSNGQFPFESTGIHVADLARRYPQLKILMAHLGGNCYDGIPAIEDCPNVWVDMCSSIFRGDDINYTVGRLGADRVLFGSDMAGTYLTNLGQIQEADLTDEEREKILSGNALKIFDKSFRL